MSLWAPLGRKTGYTVKVKCNNYEAAATELLRYVNVPVGVLWAVPASATVSPFEHWLRLKDKIAFAERGYMSIALCPHISSVWLLAFLTCCFLLTPWHGATGRRAFCAHGEPASWHPCVGRVCNLRPSCADKSSLFPTINCRRIGRYLHIKESQR